EAVRRGQRRSPGGIGERLPVVGSCLAQRPALSAAGRDRELTERERRRDHTARVMKAANFSSGGPVRRPFLTKLWITSAVLAVSCSSDRNALHTQAPYFDAQAASPCSYAA